MTGHLLIAPRFCIIVSFAPKGQQFFDFWGRTSTFGAGRFRPKSRRGEMRDFRAATGVDGERIEGNYIPDYTTPSRRAVEEGGSREAGAAELHGLRLWYSRAGRSKMPSLIEILPNYGNEILRVPKQIAMREILLQNLLFLRRVAGAVVQPVQHGPDQFATAD